MVYEGKGHVDIKNVEQLDDLPVGTTLLVNDTVKSNFLAMKLLEKKSICGEIVYSTKYDNQFVKVAHRSRYVVLYLK